MLDGFVSWMQDYVVYTGVLGIVEGVLGILAFGGLLSALLGNAAIKAASVAVVLIGVLGLFAVLAANRVESRRRAELDRRLIRRFCDAWAKRHGQRWHVTRWDSETHVDRNGDVRQRIDVTVVATSEMLDFCTVVDGPNWVDWPDRHRHKVKVKVYSIEADGRGGTRTDMTFTWISRSRIEIMVHLPEPVARGVEVRFVVHTAWPARCVPLMKGYSAEDFVLWFGNAVDQVQYVVVLPPGYEVCYDLIGLSGQEDDYKLTSVTNKAGQVETALAVRGAPDCRYFGMRLDLRKDRAQL